MGMNEPKVLGLLTFRMFAMKVELNGPCNLPSQEGDQNILRN